jgi:2-oxoisovalerate dehydrogenase E1 component beta subunit
VVDYRTPLGKAAVRRAGTDVTLVGWGAQISVLDKAAADASEKFGISCELIDLRTLLPWDVDTVTSSVAKTGRAIISHEAPVSHGIIYDICTHHILYMLHCTQALHYSLISNQMNRINHR